MLDAGGVAAAPCQRRATAHMVRDTPQRGPFKFAQLGSRRLPNWPLRYKVCTRPSSCTPTPTCSWMCARPAATRQAASPRGPKVKAPARLPAQTPPAAQPQTGARLACSAWHAARRARLLGVGLRSMSCDFSDMLPVPPTFAPALAARTHLRASALRPRPAVWEAAPPVLLHMSQTLAGHSRPAVLRSQASSRVQFTVVVHSWRLLAGRLAPQGRQQAQDSGGVVWSLQRPSS